MVICDLGARRGEHGEHCGLADIGEADQTHIRNGLELEGKFNGLALFARLGKLGA